jgi:hypothetical protein
MPINSDDNNPIPAGYRTPTRFTSKFKIYPRKSFVMCRKQDGQHPKVFSKFVSRLIILLGIGLLLFLAATCFFAKAKNFSPT